MRTSLTLGILSILMLLFSCRINKEFLVTLDSTNFKDTLDLEQPLTFTFNKDLVPDTMVYQILKDKPIKFDPEIEGEYKWTSRNVLSFTPAVGFQPNTKVKYTLQNSLLTYANPKLQLQRKKSFDVNTVNIDLQKTTPNWRRSYKDAQVIVLHVLLEFNAQINPIELASKLSVTTDGKAMEYRILSESLSKNIELEISNAIDLKDGTKIDFKIDRDLAIAGNENWRTQKIYTSSVTIPDKDVLKITKISADHDGEQGTITVESSQEILDEDLENKIIITPAIPFTVSISEYNLSITSEDFDVSKTYTIEIKNDIKGIIGGRMKNNHKQDILFGELEPSIKFVDRKAIFLSSKGERNIGIKIVNTPKIKLEVYKIFDNNVLHFINANNITGGDGEDYYDDYGDNSYYSIENYGTIVYKQDINTSTLPKKGSLKLLHFDIQDKLPMMKGFYILKVSDPEHEYRYTYKIVSVSDIGLIAKESPTHVWVFCNSILSAEALSGVTLHFISDNNQNLGSATTDADGVAVFEKKMSDDFKIALITAEKNEEYNFLSLSEMQVNTDQYELEGQSETDLKYQAFLFGERTIYRPGEVIHFAGAVRDKKRNIVSQMPVKFKLIAPNGKEVQAHQKTLDAQGVAEVELVIPAASITGLYTIQLTTANDLVLSTQSISVEEFMPDKIRVNLNLPNKNIILGDSLAGEMDAFNFFGTPAASRNWEVEMTLHRGSFKAKDYPQFNFLNNNSVALEDKVKNGTTDENGHAQFYFSFESDYKEIGVLDGNILATVFDETGRPVHRAEKFQYFTQDKYFGIGEFEHYINANEELKIPLIICDQAGAAIAGKANVEIIQHGWHTIMEKNETGSYRYISQEYDTKLIDEEVDMSSAIKYFSFKPKESGNYEIRFRAPDSKHYVSSSFYAYHTGMTESSSFPVERDGTITVTFDKENYMVGDVAKVLFNTPFIGKILVTVERDKVYKYFYIQTDKKSAEVTIPITDEMVSNFFVTATLFKPNVETSIPFMVAHGYAGAKVENPQNKLNVSIQAAEQSLSSVQQKITVHTNPNTAVIIAAVDEGILALKNYKTPDPYNYFYAPQALQVTSYDLYPYLYPELKAGAMTGGDAEQMSQRVNPIQNKRVRLVSYWSGIQKTDAQGNTTFDIDIPAFNGSIRLMAFAYQGSKFGNAEKSMIVKDPVVMNIGLPRFLSPGDEALVNINLTNTTDKEELVTLQLSTLGEICAGDYNTQQISIPANTEKPIWVKVLAADNIGTAALHVTATMAGKSYSDEIPITIRPAASLQKKYYSGAIKAGTDTTFDFQNTFMPASLRGTVTLSNSPLTELAPLMERLVNYPYGCLEQTVSAAFPQLYYGDMIQHIKGYGAENPNPKANIITAINKIQSMQTYNGGLSYWQGSDQESWWASIYAAHFLLEAKQNGFEINENILHNILSYLQDQLKSPTTHKYFYNTNQSKDIVPKEVPYSLYVLALAQQPSLSTMNYYKANPHLLSLDEKYMLSAAYYLTGDKRKASEILPAAYEGETSMQVLSGSFYSPIRDEAISLNVLMDTDPNNIQCYQMALNLKKALLSHTYLNTQENAFTFLALGKYAKHLHNHNDVSGTLTHAGTTRTLDGSLISHALQLLQDQKVALSVRGSGSMYYYAECSGIPISGIVPDEDSQLQVRKKFYDRRGFETDIHHLKQNDLIIVQISIRSLGTIPIDNVAITDMLPAGFEIENPRLNATSEYSWIKDTGSADYFDIRDDRVNIFSTVTGNYSHFYYIVRAVTPGTFTMGSVMADAMYDSSYHSYHGANYVTISN